MAGAGSASVVPAVFLVLVFFLFPRPVTVVSRIDGRAIDQGVAYALMVVALLVTYIVH